MANSTPSHDVVRDGRRGKFWMEDDIIDVYASKLGVYGLAMYTLLCRRAGKNGESYPSVRRISEDLGISERQAKRELKKLRDLRLISIQTSRDEKGRQQSSTYTVLDLPQTPAKLPEDSQSPREPGDSHVPGGEGSDSHPLKEDPESKEVSSVGESSNESSPTDGEPSENGTATPAQKPGKTKAVSWASYCHQRSRELVKEAKEQGYLPDTLPDRTVKEWSSFYESAITRDGYSKEQCDAAIWWLIRKASGAIEREPQGWAYFGTGLRGALAEQHEAPNAQTELEKKRLEKENAELDEMAREAARLMQREFGHG